MLDEYLALGGVELGNNARAYAYAQCLSCCAGLLKCPACTGIHDATNPWTDAQREWVKRYTNQVTNPSFETSSGTVEVRRNQMANPQPDAGTGVAVGGTASTVTTSPPLGTTQFWRNTVTSDQVAGAVGFDQSNQPFFSAISVLAASAYVRSSKAITVSVQAIGPGADGMTGVVAPNVSIQANTWVRVTLTGTTIASGAVGLRLRSQTALVTGDTFDVGAILFEKSSIIQPYFDGSNQPRLRQNLVTNPNFATSATSGWGSYWSPVRTLLTNDPNAYPGGNGNTHQVAKGTDTHSAQGIASATWARPSVGTVARMIIRIKGAVGISLAIGWNTDAGAARDPLNVTGDGLWHEYSITRPAETAGTGILGVKINAVNSNTWPDNTPMFWVDSVMAEHDTSGVYFDGTTPPADGSGLATTWSGTANFSVSYVYDQDLTAAWISTAFASVSTLTGAGLTTVATASPDRAVRIRSTRWKRSGSYSVRIIPGETGYPNGSYAEVSVTGFTIGQTYTVLGTVYLEKTLVGPLVLSDGVALGIGVTGSPNPVVTYTQTATNAPGVYEVRGTFVANGTGHGIRLMNGADIGGGDVWWDDFMVVQGSYGGSYFDGSTIPETADGTVVRVAWTGAANASTSYLEEYAVTVPAASLAPPYTCANISDAPWYDPDNPASQQFAGSYLLSVKGVTDSTMTATTTEGIEDGGVVGAARHGTRAVRVRTMLVGCGQMAAEYGLAWLKAALGTSFCGRHGDGCGTADLEFFIDCPPALDPSNPDYGATTAAYRRYLHGVACTSGPVVQEEYLTSSGAYVIIVEFILTAESPFVWGETIPFQGSGSAILTAFDDIPYNLMRYPSGEVGDGVPAVTATQYAFNGSVEYGATGWAFTQTNISAGLTGGVSTDLAAVGPNSYRVRLLATGAVTDGTIVAYYDVALGALPAGSKPSVSMWAAGLTFAGAPTIGALEGFVEWRTASASVSTTPLGTVPLNGGNFAATGLTIPATATIARLYVRAFDVDAVAGDDFRLYADAFGLTVP